MSIDRPNLDLSLFLLLLLRSCQPYVAKYSQSCMQLVYFHEFRQKHHFLEVRRIIGIFWVFPTNRASKTMPSVNRGFLRSFHRFHAIPSFVTISAHNTISYHFIPFLVFLVLANGPNTLCMHAFWSCMRFPRFLTHAWGVLDHQTCVERVVYK